MTGSVDPPDQIAQRMVESAPQALALGMELVFVERGRGALRLPWREDIVGDPDTGVIAGGVVTTLLDHVCGLAVTSYWPDRIPTATLDLRIDYMRAAAPRAAVIGEAHCYKITRSIAFVRATAHDGDPDDPVATAQGTFMLNRVPDRSPGA